MQTRIDNLAAVIPEGFAAIQSLIAASRTTSLPASLFDLVHLRTSQINACAPCIDGGSRQARKAGESDEQALVRELREELGVDAVVGDRVGPELVLAETAVMRVYLCATDADPVAHEHDQLRWLAADELDDVPWIPADAPVLAAIRPLLAP